MNEIEPGEDSHMAYLNPEDEIFVGPGGSYVQHI